MAAHLTSNGRKWVENSKYTGTMNSGTWTNIFGMGGQDKGDMWFAHGYLNGNNGGQGYHSVGWLFNTWDNEPACTATQNLAGGTLQTSGTYLQYRQNSGATQSVTAHLWKTGTHTYT